RGETAERDGGPQKGGSITEGRRAPERGPGGEARPDRPAGIACRRLHVDPPERRDPPHFAVSNRVHSAPTREREVGESVAFLQNADQVKERFFVHRLYRARDVAMPIIERIVSCATRS